MKKQDIINALETKFYLVPEPKKISSEMDIGQYQVFPMVKNGDVLYSQCVTFYVENEGEEDECAYWGGAEPLKSTTQGLSDKIVAFLNAKMTDGTLKYGYIQSVNEATQKGFVVIITSGNIKKEAVVYKDAQGKLTYDII